MINDHGACPLGLFCSYSQLTSSPILYTIQLARLTKSTRSPKTTKEPNHMNPSIPQSMDTIGMFCRLNMNARRDLPIRASEMGVLIFMHKQNAPVTPVEISHFFGIKKPSVTTILTNLHDNQYIEKQKSETDGRSYTVSLTIKGKKLVEERYEAYLSNVEVIYTSLGEQDFQQLVHLLGKANKALSKENKK